MKARATINSPFKLGLSALHSSSSDHPAIDGESSTPINALRPAFVDAFISFVESLLHAPRQLAQLHFIDFFRQRKNEIIEGLNASKCIIYFCSGRFVRRKVILYIGNHMPVTCQNRGHVTQYGLAGMLYVASKRSSTQDFIEATEFPLRFSKEIFIFLKLAAQGLISWNATFNLSCRTNLANGLKCHIRFDFQSDKKDVKRPRNTVDSRDDSGARLQDRQQGNSILLSCDFDLTVHLSDLLLYTEPRNCGRDQCCCGSNQRLIAVEPKIEAIGRTIFVMQRQGIFDKFSTAQNLLGWRKRKAYQQGEEEEQEGGKAPIHALISGLKRGCFASGMEPFHGVAG